MGGHGDLARITGVSVEFCDSASSWARGPNKDTNGIHIPEDWTRSLLSSMNGPQTLARRTSAVRLADRSCPN